MTLALDELGVSTGAWVALVRRARVGPSRKAAALCVASYADPDGTSVYCGVARLSVDLECSPSTAKRHLRWLRDVGLIQRVRMGNRRRGLSDEYRLIYGADLLERIELPDPDAYRELVQAVRVNERQPARSQVTMVTPKQRDHRSRI